LAKVTDPLRGKYPPQLVAAIGDLKKEQLHGAVAFLDWIATRDPHTLAHRVYSCFDQSGEALFPAPLEHERAFVDVLQEWIDAYLGGPSPLTDGTRKTRVHGVRIALEGLRDRGYRGVAAGFSRKFIRPGTPENAQTPSLGESDWPELEGSHGYERERRALDLVRRRYVEVFRLYERLFAFGQALLNGDPVPQGADEEACEALRRGLQVYRERIKETGTVSIDSRYWWRVPTGRELWMRAIGIDIDEMWSTDKPDACAYRSAFGPSAPCMLSALGVLLCDTGWNLQPARDLRRNPFAFRSVQHACIATESIIEAWKERAGHWVTAALGERGEVDAQRAPVALERWEETVAVVDPDDVRDGYACLSRRPPGSEVSTIDILDRYAVMAEALRTEFGDRSAGLLGNAFWVCFTVAPTPRTYMYDTQRLTTVFKRDRILGRKGLTNRSIRRTWLILKRIESGSFAATRAMAGQVSTGVLMPHYLNTPTVNAELDESIAQFQAALEGIVTRDLDQGTVVERLGKSVAYLERMRRVADRSGLTATLGLAQDDKSDKPSGHLHFRATNQRLEELYLIHRKLRHMQTHYANRTRFRLDFLPLLALAKAIGREVFAAHLGPRYRSAARRMSNALRAGEIALPVLED